MFHLQRQQAAAAESTLEQCLERSPRDEKLLLQLAFVLNSSGRSVEARELMAEQSFHTGSGRASSPRYRYSLWPAEELAATRDRVRARAQTELSALASGLGAEGKETAP